MTDKRQYTRHAYEINSLDTTVVFAIQYHSKSNPTFANSAVLRVILSHVDNAHKFVAEKYRNTSTPPNMITVSKEVREYNAIVWFHTCETPFVYEYNKVMRSASVPDKAPFVLYHNLLTRALEWIQQQQSDDTTTPHRPTILYRGLKSSGSPLSPMWDEDNKDLSFLSTSSSEAIAEEFKTPTGVMLEIEATAVIDISKYSSFQREEERILPLTNTRLEKSPEPSRDDHDPSSPPPASSSSVIRMRQVTKTSTELHESFMHLMEVQVAMVTLSASADGYVVNSGTVQRKATNDWNTFQNRHKKKGKSKADLLGEYKTFQQWWKQKGEEKPETNSWCTDRALLEFSLEIPTTN